MSEQRQSDNRPILSRLPTGIAGFDAITGGGLPTRHTLLITGSPGTGKTTFGNQLAFAHAAQGGRVIVATLLTESHDVLLENLQSFGFFDADMVGDPVQYLSLLAPLMEGGLNAAIDVLRQEVRQANATLLVVDGTAVADDFASSTFDLRHFAQRLESQSSLLGCTTVLLTSTSAKDSDPLWAHVNGVVLMTNRLVGSRHVRMLELVKMRGAGYASGAHEFAIREDGITVFPRLESLAGGQRQPQKTLHGLGTGVSGLDSMLGGGLTPLSTTVVMGTPGAGKTILGLHFLVEGAARGERGLFASFHETVEDLSTTAEGIGLDLRGHIESGLIRVLWNPPLELSVDDWAWQVLTAVEEHKPARVFLDAITDAYRIMTEPQRTPMFVAALVNELRARRATALITAEIDEYTSEKLAVPFPAASATMDNGILLRHVEIQGQLRRLVAVPKVRQSISDPSIRELQITDQGIVVTRPFAATSGLLTGRAGPASEEGEGETP